MLGKYWNYSSHPNFVSVLGIIVKYTLYCIEINLLADECQAEMIHFSLLPSPILNPIYSDIVELFIWMKTAPAKPSPPTASSRTYVHASCERYIREAPKTAVGHS